MYIIFLKNNILQYIIKFLEFIHYALYYEFNKQQKNWDRAQGQGQISH